jgi:hypothetical protein
VNVHQKLTKNFDLGVTKMNTSKKLLIATLTAALAGVTQGVYAKNEGKVDICHNGHVINIAQAAVAAHLAHGDTEGACPAPVVEPAPVTDPAPVVEEPVVEVPVAEEPVVEEPVAEVPVAEEPVAEEPVAEEPVAEEPVVEEEVVAEEPVEDRVVPEDMPPVDEIEAVVPAEPTHEEIIAQLLVEAETLTEGTLKDGFLTLPEVQMTIFGFTFSYAVVLEEITAEDGLVSLIVAGIKDVEPREGVASAVYSLEDGQAIIPVVNVAVEPAPVEEVVAEVTAPAEEIATEEVVAEVTTATEEVVTEESAPVEEVVATTEEVTTTEEAAPAEEIVAEEVTTEVAAPVEETATTVAYYNVVLTLINADPIAFAIESFSETPSAEEVAVTEEAAPTEETATQE